LKSIYGICLLIVSANLALAVPRFALMEDVNCASCHTYQGGGAGRSTYGKDYIRESLVKRDMNYPWMNEESELPVYFGLDTRYEIVANPDEDLRHFPMQFALYSGAELGSFVAHAEVNRISDAFRFTGGLRYEGLPLESWVSLARELPIMGWRIDDHTVFSRGGNLTPVGLEREGLPFTPYIEAPDMIEFGSAPIAGLELSLMSGTAFIDQNESLFSAIKASYSYSGDNFLSRIGVGLLNEGDVSTKVASWGLASTGFVWLGEVAQIENWQQNNLTNIAVLHQLSYRLMQGLDIIGRYEFFDQDTDLQTGAIQRSSLGVEFFPIPGVEVKLSYRQSQLDLPTDVPDSEGQILGQVHIYL